MHGVSSSVRFWVLYLLSGRGSRAPEAASKTAEAKLEEGEREQLELTNKVAQIKEMPLSEMEEEEKQ